MSDSSNSSNDEDHAMTDILLAILSHIPLLRNIWLEKVVGKPEIEEGHPYPAPYYWKWK